MLAWSWWTVGTINTELVDGRSVVPKGLDKYTCYAGVELVVDSIESRRRDVHHAMNDA